MHIPETVDHEIRGANGGVWPQTPSQYLRAAKRFGFDVYFHPPPFPPEQSILIGDTIHVPVIQPGRRLLPCHKHELAEAAMQWEGRPPEAAAGWARHEVARAIDLSEPRRYLTEGLQRRIHQAAGKVAELIDMAGFQQVVVTYLGPGKWSADLKYLETEA